MSAFADELAALRAVRHAQALYVQSVVRAYKHEVTDWCHHDLAVEQVAAKFDIPEMKVRDIIRQHPNIWSEK